MRAGADPNSKSNSYSLIELPQLKHINVGGEEIGGGRFSSKVFLKKQLRTMKVHISPLVLQIAAVHTNIT